MPRSKVEALGSVRAARLRRIEAVALGLLAILPIIPYVTFLLRAGVPRFSLFGDFALLEQATRHVWLGDTLLGPYSRFKWNHPGPMFFYIAAPFQAMFGTASTGLYVATCFVNAAAAATITAATRLFARRPHAIAALVGVLAWFAAFGNIVANPWNPLLVVLPLIAFLVTAAMFARGKTKAIFPAVVFGALVGQMHVAAVSTVVASGGVAMLAFAVGLWLRRRDAKASAKVWLGRREKLSLVLAVVVLLVLCLPPLVEQFTAPVGNLTKIWHFFAHREAPLKPLSVAFHQWSMATSWMPDRIQTRSLVDEGYIPLVMRWDPMPRGMTTTAKTIAMAHVGLTTLAAIIAGRRRDKVSIALLGFGVLGEIVAVSALRAVVGVSYHYLVFWTTAASTVAWIGVLAAFFSGLAALLARAPRISSVVVPVFIILGLAGAVMTTSLHARWVAGHPIAPASRPAERDDLRATYSALQERMAHDAATPVIHAEGAWDMAHAVELELEKDHVDVRVAEVDRWNYVGARSPEGLARPLHVYFSTTPLPLAQAMCLERLAKHGDIEIYVAAHETPAPCPPR